MATQLLEEQRVDVKQEVVFKGNPKAKVYKKFRIPAVITAGSLILSRS